MNPSKKEHKEIMSLIKDLPDMYNKNKVVERLIDGNTALVEGMAPPQGEDFFDLDKDYTFKSIDKVNHKRYAINAFKRGGIKNVLAYCNKVLEIHNTQLTAKLGNVAK